MVWLDICDEQGNAIYFDIHHVERRRVARRWRHSVSGTCGNGRVEVEVLVEPTGEGEVTFVDLYGGTDLRSRLIAGVDSLCLESGLLEAARRHCGLSGPVDSYPHHGQNRLQQVNEKGPFWQSVS